VRGTGGRGLAGAQQAVVARIEATGRYPTAVLWTALTGMFATTFPVTVLTVALPEIADDFGTAETTLAWVVTLPLLMSSLALPALGKLGDLYGHRKVFLIGFALSTITTALTATAWDAGSLIAWRTLTQVIGAATGPTSMALINSEYPPERRAKAMGYWAMVAAGSPAIGLVIGGLMIELWGWRVLFLMQAALMAVAVVVALLVLRETPRRTAPRFDIPGALMLMVGAGGAMFALSQGPAWGITNPFVLTSLVVAPLGIYGFVLAERRAVVPLLPLEFFRRHNFSAAIAGSLFTGASYMGTYFIAPFLLLGVFGYSVAATSWILLFRPVVFAAASPLGGSMASRYGNSITAFVGDGVLGLGLLVIALGAWRVSLLLVIAGSILQGLGHGLVRPPISASLANSVDESDLGIAAASERMMFQLGSALGITLLTVVYGGVDTPGVFAQTFLVGAALAGVGAVALSFLRPGVYQRPPDPPPRNCDTESRSA
jgi:MFS family permease